MTSGFLIRDATTTDIPFLVASNAAMAHETEGKALDLSTLERGVTAVFDDPARGYYLVAERAGSPVACLMITFEWSDWRDGSWWWIQSVYVVPEARREGAFRALYAEVEQRAREVRDVIGLRLYVEKHNAHAQATYLTLGMDMASYDLLERSF
jgi:GNAT superfamily N-acetyltransferase